MDKLLQILNGNARIEVDKIAVMLNMTKEQVEAAIAEYETKGVIRGYKPLLDYDKIDTQFVEAVIELKVTPKRDFGFEEIARKISGYHEVDSVYLMSGGYDLHVQVVGKTFKDIALFVAQRLAVLGSPGTRIEECSWGRTAWTRGGTFLCDEYRKFHIRPDGFTQTVRYSALF